MDSFVDDLLKSAKVAFGCLQQSGVDTDSSTRRLAYRVEQADRNGSIMNHDYDYLIAVRDIYAVRA